MSDKPIITSPTGIARWPWLNKPDARFDPDGKGKFKLDLELDPTNEAHKKFLVGLKNKTIEKHPQGRPPIIKQKDENDHETGKYLVRFKSAYRPKVFDEHGHFLPDGIEVGNGSLVRVAFVENFYDAFGGGMNLYLQAVQVLNLVEPKGMDAPDFGFEVKDAETTDTIPETDDEVF